MRKSTRIFIKAIGSSGIVTVKPIFMPNAQKNRCFENALTFFRANKNFRIVSGWIVGEYNPDFGTEIMPHYWVQDSISRQHLDPTPFESNVNTDYVPDMRILADAKPGCTMPAPMVINPSGVFYAAHKDMSYTEMNGVDYAFLYKITW
jgi:hypothetical protein